MKRSIIFCVLIFIGFIIAAQSKQKQATSEGKQQSSEKVITDILKGRTDSVIVERKTSLRRKLTQPKDSLILSDYMMSIDRVNDNLNAISDSSKLGFEVVRMGRRIDRITNDVSHNPKKHERQRFGL